MEVLYVANPMLWVQDRELWQFCQYLDPLYCLTWLKPAFVIRLQLIVHAQSILIIRMLCPPRSHAKFSVICDMCFSGFIALHLTGGGICSDRARALMQD